MPSASMRIQIGMMCPPQRANTRSTPRALRKRAMSAAAESAETVLMAGSTASRKSDSEYRRFAIGAPDRLEPLDDVAHRGAILHELDGDRHDVLLLVACHVDELVEQLVDATLVTLATNAVQARNLALGRRQVVLVRLDVELLVRLDELVDAEHDLF